MTVRGEDDLARLATSFNEMAASLQRQIRQLEELSRLQRRFVSDVSHELRTPLTTVRMAADVLHEARATSTARGRAVGRAAAGRARPVRGAAHRPARDQPVRRRRRRARPRAGRPAASSSHRVVRGSCARWPSGTGSSWSGRRAATSRASPRSTPRRVERILRNLVVNAIEHGEGRPVEIRSPATTTRSRSPCATTASGSSPARRTLVFNRFWRADPARAPHHRRHRPRPVDRARGRPAARRLAAGLGRARRAARSSGSPCRAGRTTTCAARRCRWCPTTWPASSAPPSAGRRRRRPRSAARMPREPAMRPAGVHGRLPAGGADRGLRVGADQRAGRAGRAGAERRVGEGVNIPTGPAPGASPTAIVLGLPRRDGGLPGVHRGGREYLTDEAAPAVAARAAARSSTTGERRPTSPSGAVAVEVDGIVRLSARGTYRAVRTDRRQPARSRALLADQGRRRVADRRTRPDTLLRPLVLLRPLLLPVRPVLPRPHRAARSIADPVFLPTGDQLPTQLVRGLLAGPTPWLGSQAATALPTAAQIEVSVPLRDDGVAEVQLSQPVADLSTEQQQVLSAQLVWTLRQVPGVEARTDQRRRHSAQRRGRRRGAGGRRVAPVQPVRPVEPTPRSTPCDEHGSLTEVGGDGPGGRPVGTAGPRA